MSQENVEIVKRFAAAYNARDLDAAAEMCAPDVEAFPDASVFPEAASLVGRQAFRSFLEETWDAWASGGVALNEIRDIGDERVLARADWGGTGSASGASLSTNLSQIYTIRDGRICRAEYFFDHTEALKAVGLEE